VCVCVIVRDPVSCADLCRWCLTCLLVCLPTGSMPGGSTDGTSGGMPLPGGGTTGGGGAGAPEFVRPSGSDPSSTCTVSDGTCTTSNGFVKRDLTYDEASGRLRGTFTSNHCPGHQTPRRVAVTCTAQAIPDTAFLTSLGKPQGSPLLGRVALTLKHGLEIYGPFDAGFNDGQVCSGTDGKKDCAGGTDLSVCENHMQYQCVEQGGMTLNHGMLMDACGGHAGYHLHLDPACDYDRCVCLPVCSKVCDAVT